MPPLRRQKRRGLKGKSRGFRRDRDCLTCKSTGSKCDLNRPFCGPCQSAGLECHGYENRVRWAPISCLPCPVEPQVSAPVAASMPQSSTEQITLLIGQDSFMAIARTSGDDSNWTTHHDKYLDFFTRKFEEAKLIQRSQSGHSLTEVWQFVWQRISGQLLHGGDVELDSLFLQTAALSALRGAIMDGDILAMFGIVTFSFLDVYEGPFGDWEKHLLGARALLDLHCSNQNELEALYREIPGLLQAMSLLVWYDIMGTFLRGKGIPIFDEWHRAHLSEEFFQLVWCPRDAFDLFVQVIHARESKNPMPFSFLAMEQLLRIIIGGEDVRDGGHVQNAWRYGAIISAIHVNKSELLPGYDTVMEMLGDKLCHIITTIPPESGQYRHLATTATVLGNYSQRLEHLEAVDAYFFTCCTLDIPIYPRGKTAHGPV